MDISTSLLTQIAGAIAVAAGLPVESVGIYKNTDGSFTAVVCGVAQTFGNLEKVLAWAASEARKSVDRAIEMDEPTDRPSAGFAP